MLVVCHKFMIFYINQLEVTLNPDDVRQVVLFSSDLKDDKLYSAFYYLICGYPGSWIKTCPNAKYLFRKNHHYGMSKLVLSEF